MTQEVLESPQAATLEPAPPGFTEATWKRFERDGFLIVENAIGAADIERYVAAADRVAAGLRHEPGSAFTPWRGVAHLDPVFAELIDHRRHVGYAWDVYGDQLKLHNSQAFIRPPGPSDTAWHRDGPRVVPYRLYAPRLPLQLKVAYWLTDLPRPEMGNLVVLPGSHRLDALDAYTTQRRLDQEVAICVPAGTMMLMDGNIFHRVMENRSPATRYNVFMTYCPSWVCEADRLACDPAWLQTLPRVRRILMRSYADPYWRTKPPAEDLPLFLDRDSGAGAAAGDAPAHLRRRAVTIERWL
jgi:Phytanoyl-CoA dioxygenase (PhyH)